jgi:hypothetical protein
VDETERARNWQAWLEHCSDWRVDPYMQELDKPRQQEVLLSFAVRIREGYFGKGSQVGTKTVETGLRHVAQQGILAGYPDPRRSYGSKELDLPFQRLLRTFRTEDPAPQPRLALPVATIRRLQQDYAGDPSPRSQAVADLAVVAFYFLLRVGEYTMPKMGRRTRTVQFRRRDVKFRKDGRVIPHNSPLHVLLQADHVTMYLDNQKNGIRGAVLHHYAVHGQGTFCPVQALARRIHFVYTESRSPDMPISFLGFRASGVRIHVIDSDITKAIRHATAASGLLLQGYTLRRVGSHSLRASVAMALKPNGESADTIMKLGRWTSTTFLTYIHSQIAALSTGIAQRMSRPISFTNVG